jgi:uncharacterized protein (DUF427 family)
MLNHPDIMWRYADALTRQAELDGRTCFKPPVLSAISAPRANRRYQRILGFRNRG